MRWLDLAVGTFQLYSATTANLFSLNSIYFEIRLVVRSRLLRSLPLTIAEIPPKGGPTLKLILK